MCISLALKDHNKDNDFKFHTISLPPGVEVQESLEKSNENEINDQDLIILTTMLMFMPLL
jgi:hypothetical protein